MGRSPIERFKFLEGTKRHIENDVWLPIPSSRSAKWWYSTAHNVTAIVGAGVLSLPYAMSQLGWGPGVAVLTVSWILTFYTIWQMIEMHETEDGRRFDRYHELCQHAFGKKLGLFILLPQQLTVQIGVNIVYLLTGGLALQKFHQLVCHCCRHVKLRAWIAIFSSVHFVLCHLPSLNAISGVSLAAAIMSFSYCTIFWATAAGTGVQYDTNCNSMTPAPAPAPNSDGEAETGAARVLNFFGALGTMAFSYSAHNVVLEIQATIPSPSKKRMWRGVILAYVIVALCYFPMAIIGYWKLGKSVQTNIMLSLNRPAGLIAVASMFVVIHLIGGYQIYAMPVFDMLESLFINKFRFKPRKMLSVILRSAYVAFTVIVAIFLPYPGPLLGFLGGFAFVPTTYFLPCIIWLILFKPRMGSLSWWANWICTIFGVALAILATIGGLRELIHQARTCHWWNIDFCVENVK